MKDSVPRELRSRVIYKFTYACCNACYIGETGRHFSTCVREHLSSDKPSHIFKHLLSSERCRQSCSADCFEILDSAPSETPRNFFQGDVTSGGQLKISVKALTTSPTIQTGMSIAETAETIDNQRKRIRTDDTAARFPHRSLLHYAYGPLFQETIAITIYVLWDCSALFILLSGFFF